VNDAAENLLSLTFEDSLQARETAQQLEESQVAFPASLPPPFTRETTLGQLPAAATTVLPAPDFARENTLPATNITVFTTPETAQETTPGNLPAAASPVLLAQEEQQPGTSLLTSQEMDYLMPLSMAVAPADPQSPATSVESVLLGEVGAPGTPSALPTAISAQEIQFLGVSTESVFSGEGSPAATSPPEVLSQGASPTKEHQPGTLPAYTSPEVQAPGVQVADFPALSDRGSPSPGAAVESPPALSARELQSLGGPVQSPIPSFAPGTMSPGISAVTSPALSALELQPPVALAEPLTVGTPSPVPKPVPNPVFSAREMQLLVPSVPPLPANNTWGTHSPVTEASMAREAPTPISAPVPMVPSEPISRGPADLGDLIKIAESHLAEARRKLAAASSGGRETGECFGAGRKGPYVKPALCSITKPRFLIGIVSNRFENVLPYHMNIEGAF
jgi:hypothetical protein